MKRILILAILAIVVMMPLASFARTAISDKDMDAVTAQEGVSITFTDFSATASLSSISWGDTDGFTSYLTPGYLGATDISITGHLVDISGTMNVDVGSNSANKTHVKIDLPTIAIGGSAGMNIDATIKFATDSALSTNATTLGKLSVKNFKTTVTGTVQIYPH